MQHLVRILSVLILVSFYSFANVIADKNENNLKLKLKKSGISNQNLIQITYFENSKFRLKKSHSSSDTLKILGLRVEFQTDTLKITTGNGTFNLSKSDTTIIDPSPHDREYFLAQINAISHYYQSVSNKKLIVTGNVFPLENESSYILPHTMDYYNPNTSEEELDRRLAELFQNAIQTADTQDQIPFSQFDIFVIFHAGVGQDFASDFETTPQDIPSAFLNSDHLIKYLGNNNPSFPGIQTSDGFIKEGIILPETENQEGSEFALKGIFVLYFGNQIGLPSLFNTDTGLPGIGAWGLMDVGSSNYFGLIPAQPCAWSKVFIGWEEPILLAPKTDIKIAVSKAISAPHIYKIPVNAREYFLIENRNNDYKGSGIVTGRDQYNHVLNFNPLGNFTAEIDTSAGERLGVITQVYDYDFNIPGSGILVWHIDDVVIEKNYATNTINVNPNHRGVDLEEADGSQDIGQNYGFLSPGSGSEYGVLDDAYFLENEIHQIANRTDFVSFSPNSSPSSNGYSNGISGIYLRNFSNIDSVMSFDFLNSLQYENFPQRFDGDIEIKYPPVVETLSQVVFFTPGNNKIFAWNSDGTALILNNQQLFFDDWRGNRIEFQAAVFDTASNNFSHYPIIGDLNRNGQNEIVCSANQNKIIIWSPILDSNTGYAERIYQANIPIDKMLIWDHDVIIATNDNLSSNSLSTNNDWKNNWTVTTNSKILNFCLTKGINTESFIVILLENGDIQKIDKMGQIKNTKSIILTEITNSTIISGYLENNLIPSVIISSGDQIFALTQDLKVINGYPKKVDEPIKMQPIITDLDQDGFGEIVFVTPSRLFALNHNGTLNTGFPVEFPNKFSNSYFISSSPVSILVGNETYLLIKDGLNNVLTIRGEGKLVKDYIYSGGGSTSSPFISLSNLGDDFIEIIDPNSDGFLNIRQTEFRFLSQKSSWLQTNFDEKGSNFNSAKISAQTTNQTELLSYAFNYPNPTEGNQTTFRFYINKDANVKIDIYDLAGEKVSTIESSGSGNVENEIIWGLENISSGIYMARIEAASENETAFKMIKVAVVK